MTKIEFAESTIQVSEWKIAQLKRAGNHPKKIAELKRTIERSKQFIKDNIPNANIV